MTLAAIPNGSPADVRRAAQRGRIFDAARRLFFAQGYAATTMSAIAAEVGGSKTMLWSHFDSKDALFAALVEIDSRDFHAGTLALLDGGSAPFAILADFVRAFIAAMSSPAALTLQRQVAAEADRIAVGNLLYDRLVGDVEARLTTFIAAHMRTGALRRGDPCRAARLVIALCLGLDQHRLFWPVDALGAVPAAHADIVPGALRMLFTPCDGDQDETCDDASIARAVGDDSGGGP